MAKLDQIEIDGTLYEVVPEIAPLFSASTAYAVGDCVIKDAVLYRFKTAHAAGAWIGTDAEAIEVGEELTNLKQDLGLLGETEATLTDNAYIDDSTTVINLTPIPYNNYKCAVIECTPLDVFYMYGRGYYAFADVNNNKLAKVGADNRNYEPIIPPENAAKIIVNFYTGSIHNPRTIKRTAVADCDIVKTFDDVKYTTKTYVLVLENNSSKGDGGKCLFKKQSWTTNGYERNDGTYVYPVPDQTAPNQSLAPKHELMNTIKTYVGNESLTYGQTDTLYSATCGTGIDCSAFVTAVLQGVKYSKSRYILGTSAKNITGEYCPDALFSYNSSIGWNRLVTDSMAMYFAEHKQLFTLPNDATKAANMLQFGDLLFGSYTGDIVSGSDDWYYGIGHVMFVIGTIPERGAVIVAQGGLSYSGITEYNNESTTCKTSLVLLTNTDALTKYCRVFARPRYNNTNLPDVDVLPIVNYAIVGEYIFDNIAFNLNTTTTSAGRLSYSKSWATTDKYYRVVGGSKFTYVGDTVADLQRYAAQYDENLNYISDDLIPTSGTLTLNTNTRYVRFQIGFSTSGNKMVTLAVCDTLKVKMTA